MHRLASQQAVNRFRLAAFLVLFKCALIPLAVVYLSVTILFGYPQVLVALCIAGLILPVSVCKWILTRRTRCPLCMVPPMARNGCSRHRQARTLLGSYPLRVAGYIVLRGYFRCPYCNEPTAIEVRQRQRRSGHDQA